jgi:hypothetical protein
MRVSAVSFGKKTPVMQCNVRDVWNNKPAAVTLSEYDCKDYSDIKEVYKSCEDWTYGSSFAIDMNKKRERYLDGRELFPNNFYVMQDKNKNILGICETLDMDKDTNIEYIESKRDNGYKYIGQAMIAMVGRILLNRNGKNLYVLNPYPGAINFYTDKCGFETVADYLVMTNNKINDFINRVQRKTNSEISEIKE